VSRIFISHSSFNNAEAIALRDWLVAAGWSDLFLDLDPNRGVAAGERWERALHEAAKRCEAVIFIVSRSWLKSKWCLRELSLASKLNKRIFAVLIEEDLPLAELPDDLTSQWQALNLVTGADHQMFRVNLPDGKEAHVTFSSEGLKRLKAGLEKAGLDPRFYAWPPENDRKRAPYPGLRPLEADDAGIFFGREADTIDALDRLRGLAAKSSPRFLAILGASGAGKSSFVRAGLYPRLKRDDRNFLPLPIIRPGRASLLGDNGLALSISAALQAQNSALALSAVRQSIEKGPVAVRALLLRLAEKAAPPKLDGEAASLPTIVLLIDQGEELFLAEGAAEARPFLAYIAELLKGDAPRIICVTAIRSDTYERLQTAPVLDGIAQETFSLPPIARGAYGQIIELPLARLAGTSRELRIEPQLTARLLQDIDQDDAKDALPLLAFTLERLYREEHASGALTLQGYEDIGGIGGSINAAVEDALRAADTDPAVPRTRVEQFKLLRRGLIPWLAEVDPQTGAPRRRVARLSEIPLEARPLLEHLVEARLLSTDRDRLSGEETIEPSHEALLRQWVDLYHWLQENAEELIALEGVKRSAADWAKEERSAGWLAHRGGRLEEAEKVITVNTLAGTLGAQERDYLAACRKAENDSSRREKRRTQIITYGSLAAALVVGLFAVVALQQALEAKHTGAEASRQLQRAEAAVTVAARVLQTGGDSTKNSIAEYASGLKGVSADAVKYIQERADEIAVAKNIEYNSYSKDQLLRKLIDEKVAEFEKDFAGGLAEAVRRAPPRFQRILAAFFTTHKDRMLSGMVERIRAFYANEFKFAELQALVNLNDAPVAKSAQKKSMKMGLDVMGPMMSDLQAAAAAYVQSEVAKIVAPPGTDTIRKQIDDAALNRNYVRAAQLALNLSQASEKNEIEIFGQVGEGTANSLLQVIRFKVLARDWSGANDLIEKAGNLTDDPSVKMIMAQQYAHLTLFSGQSSAKQVYMNLRGNTVSQNRSWEETILADFREFRELGFPSDRMAEVEAALRSPPPPPPPPFKQGPAPGLPASAQSKQLLQGSSPGPSVTSAVPPPAPAVPSSTPQAPQLRLALPSPAPPPSKTAPSGVPQFSIYKNYDVEIAKSELLATLPTPEAVLAALPNTVRVDLKSCEDACQKDTRCVAYTFNKWNGRCFLKKGLGLLMRFDPGAISGIVRGYSAPRFSEVTEITTRRRDKKHFPNRGPGWTAATVDACRTWCFGQPITQCLAYTYIRTTGECSGLQDAGEPQDNTEAESEYRFHEPPKQN